MLFDLVSFGEHRSFRVSIERELATKLVVIINHSTGGTRTNTLDQPY